MTLPNFGEVKLSMMKIGTFFDVDVVSSMT